MIRMSREEETLAQDEQGELRAQVEAEKRKLSLRMSQEIGAQLGAPETR